MSLDRQIHIYSVDTGAFYKRNEKRLHWKKHQFEREKAHISKLIDHLMIEAGGILKDLDQFELFKSYLGQVEFFFAECGKCYTVQEISNLCKINERYVELNYWKSYKTKRINEIKERLLALISKSVEYNEIHGDGEKCIRQLNPDAINDRNVISVFESTLTRTFGIEQNQLSDDIIVVKVFYFGIIEDLILNGFEYNGERYKFFTASAGQIRTKKTVFIKESLWNAYEQTLMCGLTVDEINRRGGINVNKFLAYLALSNSATDLWEGFDIDRCIVVPDFETAVRGVVDHVDDETYTVMRKKMDIEIEHTDGCGMVLPSVSEKNFMIRLPWVKGLLASFDFRRFIRLNKCEPIVTDIYGKEHNIIDEDIQIIFTKSQFKMHKYYSDWDEYKAYFKEYQCQAGTCKEEEDYILNAHINYQMVQTLTDIKPNELKKIAQPAIDKLDRLTSNVSTMLDVFGAVGGRSDRTPFQQSLLLYPELLEDEYCREEIKSLKKSYVEKYRYAKLPVMGKYTFLVPDLYAFCERLFLGIEEPEGLLADGEVACRLYPRAKKLDVLRAPHLYKEHAVRNNVNTMLIREWFKTDAIYTSCHDLISRILQ